MFWHGRMCRGPWMRREGERETMGRVCSDKVFPGPRSRLDPPQVILAMAAMALKIRLKITLLQLRPVTPAWGSWGIYSIAETKLSLHSSACPPVRPTYYILHTSRAIERGGSVGRSHTHTDRSLTNEDYRNKEAYTFRRCQIACLG